MAYRQVFLITKTHSYALVGYTVYTYIAMHLCKTTNHSTLLLCRAWRRKLYSMVQNGDNRKDLYQALWLIMASPDPERFHQPLQQILCTKDKEQRLIEYFQSAYTNRAGHNAIRTKITLKHHHCREVGPFLQTF